MGCRENECQISQSYILHMKLSEVYLCNHNSGEIWHSFSLTFMRNFLWCYYGWFISSLALEKCKKECNILYIILVQGFCPLKIKITLFPGGFRLNQIQSWIPDSTRWIPDSRYWNFNFKWVPDWNRYRDSGFPELKSGF